MQNRGGSGYAWATLDRVVTCIRVKQGLSVGRLSGSVTGEPVGYVTWCDGRQVLVHKVQGYRPL